MRDEFYVLEGINLHYKNQGNVMVKWPRFSLKKQMGLLFRSPYHNVIKYMEKFFKKNTVIFVDDHKTLMVTNIVYHKMYVNIIRRFNFDIEAMFVKNKRKTLLLACFLWYFLLMEKRRSQLLNYQINLKEGEVSWYKYSELTGDKIVCLIVRGNVC